MDDVMIMGQIIWFCLTIMSSLGQYICFMSIVKEGLLKPELTQYVRTFYFLHLAKRYESAQLLVQVINGRQKSGENKILIALVHMYFRYFENQVHYTFSLFLMTIPSLDIRLLAAKISCCVCKQNETFQNCWGPAFTKS